MERSQKKIHRKDELTWPAHILTCSPHVLSHVLALNGTSLLAVTCPCKNQAGWPFWCPYRNVVFFSLEPCTGRPTLKSHRSKLGLRSTSSNVIIHPTEEDGRLGNYCIIQYSFTDGEHPMSLKPHKNAKTKQKGYVRTCESTIEKLKSLGGQQGPSAAFQINKNKRLNLI